MSQNIIKNPAQKLVKIDDEELTVVEKVAKAIGFTRTCELCARFGGRTFYVPTIPPENHVLSIVLGQATASQLASAVGGQTIELPMLREMHKKREADIVCRRIACGDTDRQILLTTDLSQGQINRIKTENAPLISAYIEMMDKQNSFIKTTKVR